ncbi:hypothetical protein CQW23_14507 [Capsicum baccatum]|uniref:Uncharacterized protein n=1 Tax=Capsicum baccatum TaxID=33114 RepID=A0A2G2WJK1_CAPBA|nr:hypothetical protein CQW23_14507 [Capsicum baccatum]
MEKQCGLGLEYDNDKDRLSHRPEDVELDDWKRLVEHFGSDKFKRNPLTGEKETPYKIWEIKHTRKVQQLIVEQLSEEIENFMTSDKILSSILGERLGYVQKKGYGKNPPKRIQTQQANIESNMSSAIESMRQEIQLDMERKLQ